MSDIIPNLVSTIIPVYNRPRMLLKAAQSVLDQTHSQIEIIIADDGSTDETPDVAKNLQEQYPEIVRLTRIENWGPGPAREAGRRLARGEFVQYLDSDDRLLPDKFADQIGILREDEECDIAYGITRLVDGKGKTLADPFKWSDRKISALFPGLLVDRWWSTHTPLYRRRLTDRIGPWCDMRWSQDWEYDARAGALGAKLKSCGTLVSEHVHHDGVRQTSSANWEEDPERLKNRVRLLTVLWNCAQKSGCDLESPECLHFSRWSFSIARHCAAAGLVDEAGGSLRFALESGRHGRSIDIKVFQAVGKIFGYRLASRLTNLFRRAKKTPGQGTLQQSWMEQLGS